MKNRIALCSIFLYLSIWLQAQTNVAALKVREVYDFKVGDVFDYEYSVYPGNINHSKQVRERYRYTIIDKKDLGNSWVYTKSLKVKTYENEIQNKILIDTIYHLDSIIFKFLPKNPYSGFAPKWLITIDTTFQTNDFGGGIMSKHSVEVVPNVSGNYQVDVSYMKGLGNVLNLFSNYYPVNPGTSERTTEMVYYKKDSTTWGKPIDFTIIPTPYDPMAVEDAGWIFCNTNIIHLVKGDTSIQQLKYKKLWEYETISDNNWPFNYKIKNGKLLGLLRDDALNEKVYYRYINGDYPPKGCSKQAGDEFLLFDFKVKANDTLTWCQFGNDKGIVKNKSINMPYQNKFVTTGFNMGYVNSVNGNLVLERVGFIGEGLFYDTNLSLCSYCSPCNFTVSNKEIVNSKTIT